MVSENDTENGAFKVNITNGYEGGSLVSPVVVANLQYFEEIDYRIYYTEISR